MPISIIVGFCMKKNVCTVHGELNESNAYVCNEPSNKGGIRLRCKECTHIRRIEYYYRNREENIKKSSEWKKQNREHCNALERENRKKNLDLTRDKESCRKKGMTLELYYSMCNEQNNLCAICGNKETRKTRSGDISKRLSIDHCHKTNFIRGLLCHDCNTGIGKFRDDIDRLQSAINYLKKHQQ